MTTNTNAALREKLIDLIAEHLSGTYHCTRVWEAWNVGTMSQDDFEDVGESDTPAELADAILAEISTAAQPPADGALNTIAALRAQLAEAQRDSERSSNAPTLSAIQTAVTVTGLTTRARMEPCGRRQRSTKHRVPPSTQRRERAMVPCARNGRDSTRCRTTTKRATTDA